ncbi:hypothetical protein ADUPG1_008671 [Aduncisulcus paluster]|uniref:Uncharacterized protein n=1 Tax=Aduncisulcus paluster TaxID=2918883 RepID=A0ABQ5KU59_9EUKA|nr:hypothetical protein ADUPG1_008671 [Aduncisulcus paluster]
MSVLETFGIDSSELVVSLRAKSEGIRIAAIDKLLKHLDSFHDCYHLSQEENWGDICDGIAYSLNCAKKGIELKRVFDLIWRFVILSPDSCGKSIWPKIEDRIQKFINYPKSSDHLEFACITVAAVYAFVDDSGGIIHLLTETIKKNKYHKLVIPESSQKASFRRLTDPVLSTALISLGAALSHSQDGSPWAIEQRTTIWIALIPYILPIFEHSVNIDLITAALSCICAFLEQTAETIGSCEFAIVTDEDDELEEYEGVSFDEEEASDQFFDDEKGSERSDESHERKEGRDMPVKKPSSSSPSSVGSSVTSVSTVSSSAQILVLKRSALLGTAKKVCLLSLASSCLSLIRFDPSPRPEQRLKYNNTLKQFQCLSCVPASMGASIKDSNRVIMGSGEEEELAGGSNLNAYRFLCAVFKSRLSFILGGCNPARWLIGFSKADPINVNTFSWCCGTGEGVEALAHAQQKEHVKQTQQKLRSERKKFIVERVDTRHDRRKDLQKKRKDKAARFLCAVFKSRLSFILGGCNPARWLIGFSKADPINVNTFSWCCGTGEGVEALAHAQQKEHVKQTQQKLRSERKKFIVERVDTRHDRRKDLQKKRKDKAARLMGLNDGL